MPVKTLTQARLKELLEYNPETGVFIRLVSAPNARAGDIAGTKSGGYRAIMIDYKLYRAHRLAFLYMTGRFPESQTDHINHIKDDNRWANLRAVTSLENHRNLGKSKNNTSGVCGVYWAKNEGKWMACINLFGKKKHIGYFVDKSDAIQARKAAEVKHGFHENHGK